MFAPFDWLHVLDKVFNHGDGGAPYCCWLGLQILPLRDSFGTITHFATVERGVLLDKRRLDEIEYLADPDTLTGILNRRTLPRGLEAEIETAGGRIHAAGRCLAFIDVDNFKKVNDVFGHATGDSVLYGVADRLAENIRRSDILGRLGSEEFAVCTPIVSLREGKAFADRLLRAIAKTPFDTPSGPISVTVSIGVAALEQNGNLSQLIERADAAMHMAKQQTHN